MPRSLTVHTTFSSYRMRSEAKLLANCGKLLQTSSAVDRPWRLQRDGQCLPCTRMQLCGAWLGLFSITNRRGDTSLSSFGLLLSARCLELASDLPHHSTLVAWPVCKQCATLATGGGRSEKCRSMRHLQVQINNRNVLVYTAISGILPC